jgi:transcriptional regulator with XRE-family HTH domain
MNIVGHNLRRFRKLNKLVLRDVSKKVERTIGCISHFEHGRRQPDAYDLLLLARVYKCDPQDFFDDNRNISQNTALQRLKLTIEDLLLIQALRKNKITSLDDLNKKLKSVKA